MAAVIIAMLTACGNKQPTATADEVIGTSVQTVTQVVTDSQGNTHIEEATKVVEVTDTACGEVGKSYGSSGTECSKDRQQAEQRRSEQQ